jgi:VCBS repeat-containing protein
VIPHRAFNIGRGNIVMAISTISFSKTPQAQNDAFAWAEDELLASGLFDQPTNVIKLNVTSNDLGGAAKSLWSIDNGDFLSDLATNNVNTGWEATANGNLIRIVNGQVEIDISNSVIAATTVGATPGVDDVNALAAGVAISDSFTYAIQLGNGTLSYATVSISLVGENDAATISATLGGDYSVTKNGSEVSFATDGIYPTNAQYISDAAVADVNGDGYADILTVNNISSSVSVFLNDGTGVFGAAISNPVYAGSGNTNAVTTADVNGDGYLDLVTADAVQPTVSVLLGDGTGVFGPATHYNTGAGAGFTNTTVAVDVDGDGLLDLVANGSGGLISVLLNNGSGFDPAVTYNAGVGRLSDLAFADMDGDGDADIVNAGVDTHNVSILFNNGAGVFGTAGTYATGGTYPGEFALSDIDGDGDSDIVTVNQFSDNVSVLTNDGTGAFEPADLYSTGGDESTDIAIADMNGDGNVDIVTSNITSQTVSVLLGDGDGGFGTPATFAVDGEVPHQLALGDFNGDGATDIVSGDTGTVETGFFQGDVSILFNASVGGDPSASGDLDIIDVDAGEAKFAAVAPADLEGTYGAFTFDADTGAWSYTLDNLDPDTQALTASQTAYDSLTVASLDGTDEFTITVNIYGSELV